MPFPSPSPSYSPHNHTHPYPFPNPIFPTSFRQCVLPAQRIRCRDGTQFHWCLDDIEVHARNQLPTRTSGPVEICGEKEILDRGGGGSGCRDNESRGHGLDCFCSWMGSLGKYIVNSSSTTDILTDACTVAVTDRERKHRAYSYYPYLFTLVIWWFVWRQQNIPFGALLAMSNRSTDKADRYKTGLGLVTFIL